MIRSEARATLSMILKLLQVDYQLRLELVGRASKISVCEFLGRKKYADSHRQYFASVRLGFPCHLPDLLTQGG